MIKMYIKDRVVVNFSTNGPIHGGRGKKALTRLNRKILNENIANPRPVRTFFLC